MVAKRQKTLQVVYLNQLKSCLVAYAIVVSFGSQAVPVYALLIVDQSVLNAAARLIHRSSRYEHVTPMLRDLHWLRSPERIDFRLAVHTYRCLHGLAPRYLSDYIQSVAVSNCRRLRSSSSLQLVIRRTRLSTGGDLAFPAAGSRLWNSLPPDVTSASTLTVFRKCLKTSLFPIICFLTVCGF